tara:strand:+ start:279 stop:1118 length:840 start_codon:yes stop_codon:yes gene_type:complete
MKIDNLRPGMVFEKIKTANFKAKSKTPIKDDLYEVVKVENNNTSGYSMTAIWMGNLTTNEGCMVDITTLNNPGEWKHHDNAYVTEKHQIVKEVSFVDRDPYIIVTSKTVPIDKPIDEPKAQVPEVKQEEVEDVSHETQSPTKIVDIKKIINVHPTEESRPKTEVEENPEVILPYSSYAQLTYDDLEYLCGAVAFSFNLHKSKIPNPGSKSALVHAQELSAFRDGYTIRQVRNLGLRIKMTPNAKQEVCSYQTVIKRLMQAIVWYGRADERKILRQSGAK